MGPAIAIASLLVAVAGGGLAYSRHRAEEQRRAASVEAIRRDLQLLCQEDHARPTRGGIFEMDDPWTFHFWPEGATDRHYPNQPRVSIVFHRDDLEAVTFWSFENGQSRSVNFRGADAINQAITSHQLRDTDEFDGYFLRSTIRVHTDRLRQELIAH